MSAIVTSHDDDYHDVTIGGVHLTATTIIYYYWIGHIPQDGYITDD